MARYARSVNLFTLSREDREGLEETRRTVMPGKSSIEPQKGRTAVRPSTRVIYYWSRSAKLVRIDLMSLRVLMRFLSAS
jgi:hypothetical protein